MLISRANVWFLFNSLVLNPLELSVYELGSQSITDYAKLIEKLSKQKFNQSSNTSNRKELEKDVDKLDKYKPTLVFTGLNKVFLSQIPVVQENEQDVDLGEHKMLMNLQVSSSGTHLYKVTFHPDMEFFLKEACKEFNLVLYSSDFSLNVDLQV